jgi:hypothetical protein
MRIVARLARVFELIVRHNGLVLVLRQSAIIKFGGHVGEGLRERGPRLLAASWRFVIDQVGSRLHVVLRLSLDCLPGDRILVQLVTDLRCKRAGPPGQLDHDLFDARRTRSARAGYGTGRAQCWRFLIEPVGFPTACGKKYYGHPDRRPTYTTRSVCHLTKPLVP